MGKCCRRIEREILEMAYSWDSEGIGKTDLAGIRNKAEQNKSRIDVYHTHTHTHTHTYHGVSMASGIPRYGGCVQAL